MLKNFPTHISMFCKGCFLLLLLLGGDFTDIILEIMCLFLYVATKKPQSIKFSFFLKAMLTNFIHFHQSACQIKF